MGRPPGRDPSRGSRSVAPARGLQGTVLLIGNYYVTLASLRALAAAGRRVVLGVDGEFVSARYSRFPHELWRHPPIDQPEALVPALVAFLEQRRDITVVLPLMEIYVALLSEQRERLPDGVVLACANAEAIRACLDKPTMYALAAELGVPHRKLVTASDLASLYAVAEEVGYPCVVRPSGGQRLLPHGRKASICADRRELRRTFPRWPGGHPELMVQHYVNGPLHAFYFIARHGRILASFESRALRHDRADGTGVGVAWDVMRPDRRRAEHVGAMLERLDYTGVGLAQFLVPDVGEANFLEINPRVGQAAGMFEQLGLPLTAAAVGLAVDPEGWALDGDLACRPGQRFAWTTRDLMGLAEGVLRREVGVLAAARWLSGALRMAVAADAHLTWWRQDPWPTLATYGHYLTPRVWMRKLRQTVLAAQRTR